ncbi:hypothetical protein [Glycomyces sp. NPDC021274]|uniref:hypothetical protein n=1 Tax=Glycomyces sp. NPDC021274 TaxID=3155120 RepID=UPI0033EF2D0E
MSGDHFNIQNNLRGGDVNQVFGDVTGANASVGGRNAGTGSIATAIGELIAAVNALRPGLEEEDDRVIEGAVERLDPAAGADQLSGPLKRIAGIATYVGELGVPVIRAVKAVQSAMNG